jgi:hypothetical protein
MDAKLTNLPSTSLSVDTLIPVLVKNQSHDNGGEAPVSQSKWLGLETIYYQVPHELKQRQYERVYRKQHGFQTQSCRNNDGTEDWASQLKN